MSDFIRLIRKHQPQAAIGTLLVHSYQSTYSGNTEKSTIKRWKKIANSVARLKMEYGIDFIIPYGTAIENLRASSLNNEMELTRRMAYIVQKVYQGIAPLLLLSSTVCTSLWN